MSIVETTATDAPGRPLTGVEKAAIVLLELGTERSSQIMRLLGEKEAAAIGAAVARSGPIRPSDAERSMREFAALAKSGRPLTVGGLGRARDLLEASMGAERADAILGTLEAESAPSPLEFLADVEPRQIVNYVANEHPQTVAVIVANMPPDVGSQIMSGLSDEMRRDVSVRIARLDRIASSVVHQVVAVLERRFGSGVTERREVDIADGVQRLIEILNRSDRNTERSIFEALEEAEAELADSVRSRMFVFEDILDLNDRSVQMVLRNVDNAVLATALKGVRPEVRDKVTSNMSERAAQNLVEEIEVLGQMRLSDVQEAQGAVVQIIRGLEESGDIVISRGNEEFVE